MNPESNEARPQYACRVCGADEVRGDFDSYQVYIAQGDKLIHLRSESTDPGVLALYCNRCGEEIEIDDITEIEIEYQATTASAS